MLERFLAEEQVQFGALPVNAGNWRTSSSSGVTWKDMWTTKDLLN